MPNNREWFGGTRWLDVDEQEPGTDDACCERMAWQLAQRCDVHASRYECPDSLVHRVRGGYGLIIFDSPSVVEVAFCPWCGARLPPIAPIEDQEGADV
jgi:hypothetical protein